MTRLVVLDFPAADGDEIVPLAAYTAGNLPLNVTSYSENGVYVIPYYQRQIAFTSGQNYSAINYTVTGYGVYGNVITETRAGPNANTVQTTAEFHKIISITQGAGVPPVGGTLSVGYGGTGTSTLIPMYGIANYSTPVSVAANINTIGGNLDYTIYVTLDSLTVTSTPFRAAFPGSAAAGSADQLVSATGPYNAIQIVVSQNTDFTADSLVTTILQQGLGI